MSGACLLHGMAISASCGMIDDGARSLVRSIIDFTATPTTQTQSFADSASELQQN